MSLPWTGYVTMARGEVREVRIDLPVRDVPLRTEVRSRIDPETWIQVYGAKRTRIIEAALRERLGGAP